MNWELPQPAFFSARPIVEIFERGFRKATFAFLLAGGKKGIFECFRQIGLGDPANVRRDEHAIQKARHQ